MKKILAKNNCTKKIKVQYKRNKNKYKELQINFQAFFFYLKWKLHGITLM